MKTMVALLLMALPALADVTKNDVKKLLDAKVSDSVIVEYVKANAPVRMTADDIASLKNAGATDNVLTVLAQYMSAPTRTETVYVYRPYYNNWYWSGWCWHYYRRPVYYYRPVVVVRRPVVVRPPPVRRHR